MIRSACIVVALGLAAAGSTALAAPAKPEPVMMTDAQMDNVTAGDLFIVFQDSLNNLTINLGGVNNGNAKGWENGKGNPHQSDSSSGVVTSSKHAQTVSVTINIITNVNTDATAGQTLGTQTVALSVPKK
jgi:hypothetical protein